MLGVLVLCLALASPSWAATGGGGSSRTSSSSGTSRPSVATPPPLLGRLSSLRPSVRQ